MANSSIFDLTPETALTSAHEFVAQDTDTNTRAQAVTFALMGGLEYTAYSTDGDLAAAVGKLYVIDGSGWTTAAKNINLPNSAQVGERIGLMFLSPGTFPAAILSDGTGSMIDGVDHSATAWGYLTDKMETVVLFCVKAGGAMDTDWVVVHDSKSERRHTFYHLTVDAGDSVNDALSMLGNLPARSAGTYATVEMALGDHDASNIKFDGYTEVLLTGRGEGTRVISTESAQGSAPNFWPDSLNFSANTRCGLENMHVIFQDGGTQNAVAQGAIMRASNTNLDDCWMRNVKVTVEDFDSGRTANGAMIHCVGYLPSGTSSAVIQMTTRDCTFITSSCGVIPGEGQWHYHNCDIWYGNTANTNTPHLIGMDIQRGGRVYWWGGKITTGYAAANPSTDAAVVGIRANQSASAGRAFIWNALIFARNEAASVGTIQAVHADDASGASTWIRCFGCYLQAERNTPTYEDKAAVYSSWDPTVDTAGECQVELIGCRTAGFEGNITGPDGRIEVSGTVSMQSSVRGNWFCDTTSAGFTITLSTNEPVDSDDCWIKNVGTGANTLTVAVGSGDYLDGTLNGTTTIADNVAKRFKCMKLSGTALYWESMSTS